MIPDGIRPNPRQPARKPRGGRAAAPKHREQTQQGGAKPQTELVFGAVGLEIARSHAPGFLPGAPEPLLNAPWNPGV